MALNKAFNYITKKLRNKNSCGSEGGAFDASGLGAMFFWGATAPVTADRPAPGSIWIDTTNKLVMYNSGTLAVPAWVAVGGGSALGLDAAFDIVKVIDGANSSANAMGVGDGTDALLFYTAASVPTIATNGTSDLVIAPDGGDTDITGTLEVSGTVTSVGDFAVGVNKFNVTAATGATQADSTMNVDGDFTVGGADFTVTATNGNVDTAGTLTVDGASTLTGAVGVTGAITATSATFSGLVTCTGGLNAGTLLMDALAAATSSGDISLDGNGTGGVDICSISTGGITLGDDTALATAKTLTLAGANGSAIFTITAGDAAISAGSLSITDDDDDPSLVVVNNTITTDSMVTLTSTSLTTGNVLQVTADAITSGSILFLETSLATFTGEYINCYDGAAVDFSVGLYGATIIAGNATGTDALTLTAGDITLTDGDLTLTTGDLTLTAGSIVLTPDAATDCVDLNPAADGAVFDINLAATSNLAGGYIDIDGSTGSGPVVEVAFSGAYTGDVLSLNMTNAVGAKAIDITGAGTRVAALVHITDTPATAGTTLNLDVTPVAGAVSVIDIDIGGTDDCDVITMDFAAAFTGDAIALTMANAVGAKALDIAGSGTRTASLVHITDTPEAAGGHTLDIDVTPGALTLQVIDIDIGGTDDADILCINFAAAYTGDALAIDLSNTATANGIVVSGDITPAAAVNSMGATGIPDANGRILELTSTGNASAANVGACLRVLESGAAQATTYALQVDSTSNEGLNVSTGKSHFAESVTMLGSAKVAVAANYLQATGANNAIVVAANADDTGTPIPLADGLLLHIDLAAYTLQAGANTLNYIGGGVVDIKMHTDVGADIADDYVAGGVISLMYSAGSTVWMDMGQ